MSTLRVSTIQDTAGSNSSTPAAIANGTCKAWVNFNGNTGAIRASYNVSSITKNSTGNYTINFLNALSDANYVVLGGSQPGDTADYIVSLSNYDSGIRTASAVQLISKWTNFAASGTPDWTAFNVAVFR